MIPPPLPLGVLLRNPPPQPAAAAADGQVMSVTAFLIAAITGLLIGAIIIWLASRDWEKQ